MIVKYSSILLKIKTNSIPLSDRLVLLPGLVYWSSKITGKVAGSPSVAEQWTGKGGNEAKYLDLLAASETAL